MINISYLQEIARQLSLSVKQVTQVAQLIADGSTIPFIARYRKEATQNLDEVAIAAIADSCKYFADLEKRKETVIKTIEGLGKITPVLLERIQSCLDAQILEDIYLPFKPKRKTRASQAIERGLQPLAEAIYAQQASDPAQLAQSYLSEEVKEVKDALQGARDIMAEWISEHEEARQEIRKQFHAEAMLHARVLTTKKEDAEAQKYRDYFDFQEPLSKCPSHRMLAIRRGEKEGYLLMDINIDKSIAHDTLARLFVRQHDACAAEIRLSIQDSFDRLLKPSIENEFRLATKQAADEEAIRVFAENLRQLLLAAPLGAKKVMAIDPGYRTGSKVVCLDAQGNFLHNTTIFTLSAHQTAEAIETIQRLVQQFDIQAIGVGNGTAGRETEQLVRGIDFGRPVSVFMVNESGASIYSASEVAREEFPDQDVTVRGSISIGRRLLDPLSELVKIDPKSIGVGQYQHDVNQHRLKESLDAVVESAVNHVGVNLNTASKHLLTYVSGLSATLAGNIVAFRQQHGSFANRQDLKKVPLMGPKTFEQCAGFLRIQNGAHPLDNSAVHPESYAIVEAMAADVNCTLTALLSDPSKRKSIVPARYTNDRVGMYTIEDILKELEKPGRDPRPALTSFHFDDQIKSIDDVRVGMVVPGIVTNITNFGAFVDIGVKQDGLVHISQLSDTYVSDPNQVVKLQQQVTVTVTEVDVTRKRIGLSMKGTKDQQRANPGGTHKQAGKGTGKSVDRNQHSGGQNNPFAAQLMELKKKFKDS
jgi:protein Tex